jgi:hypothetical protein
MHGIDDELDEQRATHGAKHPMHRQSLMTRLLRVPA